ncbi:MAG: hypothetical protein IJ433_04605 [Ruminococcus sp.]|nr:hypothetical protein [Ruminococcus sp.]
MMKRYKLGFDFLGLILFALMMIPTLLWSFIQAPNDILRTESITPVIDIIASISQTVMIASLCLLINKNSDKLKLSPMIIATVICFLMYFLGWILYYCGVVNPLIILDLTIPPSLAFVFYAIDRKNIISVATGTMFLICHLIFGVVNFIL